MSSWANSDHDIYYAPVSIDTVGTHVSFAETLLLVLREGCVEDHVAEAFLVEARQDQVEQSGTLDAIVDPRDNRTTFMDEQELAEEADFLDTLPLAVSRRKSLREERHGLRCQGVFGWEFEGCTP